ncbi:MAG: hypothetical protein ABR507_05395 [Actinomycetota bacterium]|nr:hypothetical protein [Actinomycetota bacterium]
MKLIRWTSLCLLLCTGCISTPFDFNAYEAKAVGAAQGVLSAVNSARLAVHLGAKGKSYQPYLEVILRESEEDATGIEGQFDSVQPPGPDSDALRDELDKMMQTAGATLTELRIHVRRGEIQQLADLARPLNGVSSALDEFQRSHEH